MNERERMVNRDLGLLDEAHYTGRIGKVEYRARRRNVLSALRDSHGVTARNAVTRPAAPARIGEDAVLPMLLGGRAGPNRTLLVLCLAGALVCAVLLAMLFFAA